jgi:predicted O-methyltransferase YrrM
MSATDPQTIRLQRVASMLHAQYIRHCESRGYAFTTDWFSHNLHVWHQVLRPLAHAPDLRFLEVGSWEGRSTCWLLDNILTDASATLTCIDTFEGNEEHQRAGAALESVQARFDANVVRTGAGAKVTRIVGRSQDVLRTLPRDAYDLLYVDGSHVASDVLEDIVLGWGLVKVKGLIVLDDYEWTELTPGSTRHPKLAIDAFTSVFRDRIRIVHQGYQVIVEKGPASSSSRRASR